MRIETEGRVLVRGRCLSLHWLCRDGGGGGGGDGVGRGGDVAGARRCGSLASVRRAEGELRPM